MRGHTCVCLWTISNMLVCVCFLLSWTAVWAADVSDAATARDVTPLLNFALNQEYLAANFFSYAAYGKGLPADITGYSADALVPEPLGARQARISESVKRMAESVANDEIAHVKTLRSILGQKAVKMPLLDIGRAFTEAADVASMLWTGRPLAPPFDPYASDMDFLLAAFMLADLEPSSYTGVLSAASNMSAEATVIIARILSVEAYHAGAVRAALLPLYNRRLYPRIITVGKMAELIARLRTHLDGSSDKADGVTRCGGTGLSLLAPSTTLQQEPRDSTTPAAVSMFETAKELFWPVEFTAGETEGGGDDDCVHDCALEGRFGLPILAPRNEYGLGFVRTMEQVVRVLVNGCPDSRGGFFPNGLSMTDIDAEMR